MPFLQSWAQRYRLKAMGRLLGEFAAHKRQVTVILCLGLVVSAVQPYGVKVTQEIIDSLTKIDQKFYLKVFKLVPIFVVSGFSKYFYNTLRRFLAERIILKVRGDLFHKYMYFPLSVMDEKRTGEILSNLQNDLTQMNQGIDTLCSIFKEPFTFLGLMGVAFYFDWRLTLCTLIVAPIVAQLFSRSGAAVKRYSQENMEQFSDLISLSQESIVGARVVKIFRLERRLIDKFHEIQARYFSTARKSIEIQEIATPAVEFIGILIAAAVFLYGGYQIAHGAMSPGQLIGFVFTLGLSQMPIKQINNAYLKLKIAEAAAERVYEILDTPNPTSHRRGSRRISSFEGAIVYEKVGLKYGDKRALTDVSFEVRRGECVALVGHSGCGKTSLIHLLPRLYEVSEGRITVDGVDIRDIYTEDLRGLISFVTQDVFLFNDSIYENILYGDPFASRKRVEEAAELAHCTDFIQRFPKGFETKIGDRGICLSGGERQRVAIARAILKGAPILVLDEATSNLDSHSESVVQSALEQLMAGKTTLLVTHRLSSVRRAQKIVVLEEGHLKEIGSHDHLASSNGVYHRLLERQWNLSN